MNVRVGAVWSDQVLDLKLEGRVAFDALFLGHYSMEDGLEYLSQYLQELRFPSPIRADQAQGCKSLVVAEWAPSPEVKPIKQTTAGVSGDHMHV